MIRHTHAKGREESRLLLGYPVFVIGYLEEPSRRDSSGRAS
jgi:hypothetical protein